MTTEELHELASILSEHTDDIQGMAAELCSDVDVAYSSTDANVLSCILVFLDSTGKYERGTAEYIGVLDKFRKRIIEIRSESIDKIMEYVGSASFEISKEEDKFSLSWLVALFMMLGIDASTLRNELENNKNTSNDKVKYNNTSSNDIMDYGVYNGMTISEIIENIILCDSERLYRTAIRYSPVYSSDSTGEIDGRIIADVKKNFATALRQLNINISMVVNGMSNDAEVKFAKEHPEQVSKLMWVTEKDERVCDDCYEMDSETFVPSDAPPCPLHPNCRCRLVPVPSLAEGEIKHLMDYL